MDPALVTRIQALEAADEEQAVRFDEAFAALQELRRQHPAAAQVGLCPAAPAGEDRPAAVAVPEVVPLSDVAVSKLTYDLLNRGSPEARLELIRATLLPTTTLTCRQLALALQSLTFPAERAKLMGLVHGRVSDIQAFHAVMLPVFGVEVGPLLASYAAAADQPSS